MVAGKLLIGLIKFMKKILLISDAWLPQVNGVVTTLTNLTFHVKKNGHKVYVFHPLRCRINFPMPFYNEIRIGLVTSARAKKLLTTISWDHVHIATAEGVLGSTFARACRSLNLPFSTSCHTKFPEFIHAKFPLFSVKFGWKMMRHLYRDSTNILTTTPSMKQELINKGFKQQIHTWTRGVDREIFTGKRVNKIGTLPILLYVGRVSAEKNLEDFFNLDIGKKVRKICVGDGPFLQKYKQTFPHVEFVGVKKGKELASYYQMADVFVFPSKTDTFGVVMLESMACGTPIAAFPVTGPIDVVENNVNGYLSNDLKLATLMCLDIDRKLVRESSLKWTWETCYRQFMDILLPI